MTTRGLHVIKAAVWFILSDWLTALLLPKQRLWLKHLQTKLFWYRVGLVQWSVSIYIGLLFATSCLVFQCLCTFQLRWAIITVIWTPDSHESNETSVPRNLHVCWHEYSPVWALLPGRLSASMICACCHGNHVAFGNIPLKGEELYIFCLGCALLCGRNLYNHSGDLSMATFRDVVLINQRVIVSLRP